MFRVKTYKKEEAHGTKEAPLKSIITEPAPMRKQGHRNVTKNILFLHFQQYRKKYINKNYHKAIHMLTGSCAHYETIIIIFEKKKTKKLAIHTDLSLPYPSGLTPADTATMINGIP